jgi:hypothetical protein
MLSYLEQHPNADRLQLVQVITVRKSAFSSNLSTQLYGVAKGCDYLHSLDPPLVHADIRGVSHPPDYVLLMELV